MKKKKIFLIIIFIITFLLVLYFIGMFFFGGKKISIKLNSEIKSKLISLYEVNGLDEENVVSFEYITYTRSRTCVLKIKKNDEAKKIIEQNPHIDKYLKLKLFGFPYDNEKYMPYYSNECCCFNDDDYYYLSVYYGGSDYNKNISKYFWELYNNE